MTSYVFEANERTPKFSSFKNFKSNFKQVSVVFLFLFWRVKWNGELDNDIRWQFSKLALFSLTLVNDSQQIKIVHDQMLNSNFK